MAAEQELNNMNTNSSSQNEGTRRRDEEANTKSDSENSNLNSINEESQQKRKRYNRHTFEQIQELEVFYKEYPHPNDKQRAELSQQLGMEPLQVKFWFQNKRTQMKTQNGHVENKQLRMENEKLRAENLRFKEAMSNASCPYCGMRTPIKETSFHEHHLRLENSRLRQEIDQISSFATTYVHGNQVPASMEMATSSTPLYVDNWSSMNNGEQSSTVVDLATSAMEELTRVAQLGEPLWVPSTERNSFVLNEEEYLRDFSRVFKQKTDGFKSEESRESVVVASNAANVAEILMDVEKYKNVFSGVVSRAMNLQTISSGLGGTCNEAMLVLNAEFHVPSPLVPTRESQFLRYCKRHIDGMWVVVDVSLDHPHMTSSVTCRRWPSGCLIQDVSSGYSKVTWVEHVEVEDGGIHSIYKPLITSGLAFGARRWVAILEGYCQRLVRTYSIRVPSEDSNNFLDQDARRSMLMLGERMVTKFCRGLSTSIMNPWTSTIPGNGNESVKFMTRSNVDDPSTPFGLLLTIATSFWLSVPPKRVYDFLCDQNTRKEWDSLLYGGDVEQMAEILSGNEESHVTLYQIKGTVESSSSPMKILQESRSDPTASYVVYAPLDMACTNMVLGGQHPSHIPLLPSGFAILPDGPISRGQRSGIAAQADTGGSLITFALQILLDSKPNANLATGSVDIASKIIWSTVENVKQALIHRS